MAILEASATDSPTTGSTTDVLLPSMTIVPGAGDFLVVFTGVVENDTGNESVFVSIYVGGVQVAHTERQFFSESSLTPSKFIIAAHAHVSGVGASDAVEIRWRVSGGTGTANNRTLNIFPADAVDVSQATATGDDTTTSTTDTLLAGMTLTPGAGDYVALFSTSAKSSAGGEDDLAFSIYVGGVQVAHTERFVTNENSIPDTELPVFIAAKVSPTAGQAVEIRWRRDTGSGTLTAHQRTLTLFKTDAGNIFEASATGDTSATNTTDALLAGMTLTPGAGDYLALFSTHVVFNVAAAQDLFHSIYVNAVQKADSERNQRYDFSLQHPTAGRTELCNMTNGKVSPGDGEAVEIRWRAAAADSRTAHERTFLLLKEVTLITSDAVTVFESLVGLTKDEIPNEESLITAQEDKGSNLESLLTVQVDRTLNFESLISVLKDATPPFESLIGVLKDAGVVIEALSTITADRVVNVEAEGIVSTNQVANYETLISIAKNAVPNFESLLGVLKDTGVNISAEGFVTSDASVNFETLISLVRDAGVNFESLISALKDVNTNFESLISVAQNATPNFESLLSLVQAAIVNYETLIQLQADVNANIEALAGVQQDAGVNIESQGTVITVAGMNLESLGTATEFALINISTFLVVAATLLLECPLTDTLLIECDLREDET